MNQQYYRKELEDIFNTVKHFISDHGLIIYGGMAVDLTLKFNGKKGLYDENEIPDYDVYTPDMNLIYELADIIAKKYKNTHVINAIHVTTLRVRCFGIFVADFSFIPQHIFDKFEYINYPDGDIFLKVANYKLILADIHRSFLSPFRGNAILQRVSKNMDRMNMINEIYADEPNTINDHLTLKVKKTKYMHGGVAAYCFIMSELGMKFKEEKDHFIFELESEVKDNIVIIPINTNIKEEVLEYRAPLMEDLIPKSALTNYAEYHEFNAGVSYVNIKGQKVLNIHGVMMYFLAKDLMGEKGYYELYKRLKNAIIRVNQSNIKKKAFMLTLDIFDNIDPIESTILVKFHESRIAKNKAFVWPFKLYNPPNKKPTIEDHILLKIGQEPINSFHEYEHLFF